MASRELVRNIIAGNSSDRVGLWLGDPLPDTLEIYLTFFKQPNQEEWRKSLSDDLRWLMAERFPPYFGPDPGEAPYFPGIDKSKVHANQGPLAQCEHAEQLEEYPWPDPSKIRLDSVLQALRQTGPYYRASGFWSPFFHHMMDLFGMETFLIKLYTHPQVVEAAMQKVCQFYYDINEQLFIAGRGLIDGFFFGNDFGTQRDILINPNLFDQFVMPWIRIFADQAHRHGLQIILHSCGSVYKVIDRFIDAGIDCLHPIQAKAYRMEAKTLAQFREKISFMGGVDTQELLVQGTPQEVKKSVHQLIDRLGPRLIVSPSHEALLPNVPPKNVQAMVDAVFD
ncbi:hypothetical protein GF406_00090 [candidate division KSB1 bacterium]|nr:hypothetical protein [candidate division KSB1 bacterium]